MLHAEAIALVNGPVQKGKTPTRGSTRDHAAKFSRKWTQQPTTAIKVSPGAYLPDTVAPGIR